MNENASVEIDALDAESLTDGEPLSDWPIIDAQEEDIRLLQGALEAKSSEIEGLREQLRESEARWKGLLQEERDGSARLLVALRSSVAEVTSLRKTMQGLHDHACALSKRLRDLGDQPFGYIPDP